MEEQQALYLRMEELGQGTPILLDPVSLGLPHQLHPMGDGVDPFPASVMDIKPLF